MNWKTETDARLMMSFAAKHLDRQVLCWVLCEILDGSTHGWSLCREDVALRSAVRRWCLGVDPVEEVVRAQKALLLLPLYDLSLGENAVAECALGNDVVVRAGDAVSYLAVDTSSVGVSVIHRCLPHNPARVTYHLIGKRIVHQCNLQQQPPEVQVAWDVIEGAR